MTKLDSFNDIYHFLLNNKLINDENFEILKNKIQLYIENWKYSEVNIFSSLIIEKDITISKKLQIIEVLQKWWMNTEKVLLRLNEFNPIQKELNNSKNISEKLDLLKILSGNSKKNLYIHEIEKISAELCRSENYNDKFLIDNLSELYDIFTNLNKEGHKKAIVEKLIEVSAEMIDDHNRITELIKSIELLRLADYDDIWWEIVEEIWKKKYLENIEISDIIKLKFLSLWVGKDTDKGFQNITKRYNQIKLSMDTLNIDQLTEILKIEEKSNNNSHKWTEKINILIIRKLNERIVNGISVGKILNLSGTISTAQSKENPIKIDNIKDDRYSLDNYLYLAKFLDWIYFNDLEDTKASIILEKSIQSILTNDDIIKFINTSRDIGIEKTTLIGYLDHLLARKLDSVMKNEIYYQILIIQKQQLLESVDGRGIRNILKVYNDYLKTDSCDDCWLFSISKYITSLDIKELNNEQDFADIFSELSAIYFESNEKFKKYLIAWLISIINRGTEKNNEEKMSVIFNDCKSYIDIIDRSSYKKYLLINEDIVYLNTQVNDRFKLKKENDEFADELADERKKISDYQENTSVTLLKQRTDLEYALNKTAIDELGLDKEDFYKELRDRVDSVSNKNINKDDNTFCKIDKWFLDWFKKWFRNIFLKNYRKEQLNYVLPTLRASYLGEWKEFLINAGRIINWQNESEQISNESKKNSKGRYEFKIEDVEKTSDKIQWMVDRFDQILKNDQERNLREKVFKWLIFFLFIETSIVFWFAHSVSLDTEKMKNMQTLLNILIPATIAQITVMIYHIVKSLFPNVKEDTKKNLKEVEEEVAIATQYENLRKLQIKNQKPKDDEKTLEELTEDFEKEKVKQATKDLREWKVSTVSKDEGKSSTIEKGNSDTTNSGMKPGIWDAEIPEEYK